jgi:serine protease Do
MYIKEAIKMRRCMFVLMALMVSLVNAQTLEECFERAYRDAIREAQKSSWALRIIAVALAEAGQLERAIQTLNLALQNVRTGEDAANRSVDLSGIAISLAKAGQIDRAIQIAQKFDYAWDSWRALNEIAKMLAKAGQFDRAIQITQKIEDAEVRSLALSEIAAELAKAGQFNRANQIFNLAIQIAQKSSCSSALAEIAKVLIKVGQIDRANKIFNLTISNSMGN